MTNITDRTDYIQNLLDSGRHEIYIGEGVYGISRPLIIHDDTSLILSDGAVMYLLDGANCSILENDALPSRGYNRNIKIKGGIWDGNNAGQVRRTFAERMALTHYEEDFYYGILIRMVGVENFTFSDLTVRNPESYAIMLTNAKYFTVENIRFDYNNLRPNMDGIHIQGTSRFGHIRNISGNTNDDMVALNCDDTYACEITCGEISDVSIDGLYCDNGYTAIRLLSCGHKCENISARNIFGSFRCNAVSFTHHNVHPGNTLREINNVTLENIHVSKSPDKLNNSALIWFADSITCKNIIIRNLFRGDSDSAVPTIHLDDPGKVDLHTENVFG